VFTVLCHDVSEAVVKILRSVERSGARRIFYQNEGAPIQLPLTSSAWRSIVFPDETIWRKSNIPSWEDSLHFSAKRQITKETIPMKLTLRGHCAFRMERGRGQDFDRSVSVR